MTGTDWILVAIVGAGGLLGLRRGAVAGSLDLLAIVAGFAAALFALPWIDDWLVGLGIDHRILLIVLTGTVFGIVAAVSGMILRIVAAPLGLARKVPPFGLLDSLIGVGPGLAKGGIVATLVVLIVLLQFPATTTGARVRRSTFGEALAVAGSIGLEHGADWAGQDIHGVTDRQVGPGQSWVGSPSMPDGDLRPDATAETEVRRLIDAARANDGLPSLDRDADLTAIAREHARDSRRGEDRRLPATVADIGDRLTAAAQNCLAVGAVLGVGDSIENVVDALMRSEAHREVILSGTYLSAGYGVLTAADGSSIVVGVFTL